MKKKTWMDYRKKKKGMQNSPMSLKIKVIGIWYSLLGWNLMQRGVKIIYASDKFATAEEKKDLEVLSIQNDYKLSVWKYSDKKGKHNPMAHQKQMGCRFHCER